jgi:LysR family hydrogen peroxide-inducible transcriptional activator
VGERELEGEPVLLLEDGHCLRDQALALCSHAGARESAEVRASSLTTLVQMVASGFGVTLLPEGAAPVEVHPDDHVVLRRFQAPEPTRTLGLLWRKASPRAAAFAELSKLF